MRTIECWLAAPLIVLATFAFAASMLSHADVAAAAGTGVLAISPPGRVGVSTCGSALDARVFRFLNGTVANPVFDVVMPAVTDFKKWRWLAVAVWLALAILGGAKGRWAALALIPLVAASDQLTSGVIKPLAARLRPCEVLGSVHLWREGTHWIWTPAQATGGFKTSFGFPSSHAANFTASMLFLSLVYRRWVPYLCLPFAGLISLSRIYVGVHWPSDVLVGIAVGAALGWLAYFVFTRLRERRRTARVSGSPKNRGDQGAARDASA
jgi:undecaprenyl-diphosphatase